MQNPLLSVEFTVEMGAVRPEHVGPAIDELLLKTQNALDQIASDTSIPTYASVLDALDRVTADLDHAMGVVGHLESVATTPELRAIYNEIKPKVTKLYSGISLDAGLWNRLIAYARTSEAKALTGIKRRHLDKTLDSFRRHGAELGDAGKERLSAIDLELSRITTLFTQNVLDATNAFEMIVEDEAKLAGLPDSARDAARQSAANKGKSGYRFTLQAPSVMAVLTYLDDRAIREHVWRAHNTRATVAPHDNRDLITQILALRKERAKVLGFDTFADLVLNDRMAKTGDNALAFVTQLTDRTRKFFERENEELSAFRHSLGGTGEMQPWDVGYYAEKQRLALYDFDEEMLRPYFVADRVVAALFETAKRLYGVSVVSLADASKWDESVTAHELRDEDGSLLARFYVDLYPRESKRDGAWMSPLISDTSGPHLGLMCANVTPPVGDRPSLLSLREVETLFHEFGHLLHHCFSKVDVRGFAGTNVAWDFVELPSQIMENWCMHREAVDLYGSHYASGEKIPDALFDRMKRARNYRAANAMMRQLGFATADLLLHTNYSPAVDGGPLEYGRRVFQKYAAAALPADYAMLAGFTHLFSSSTGYAAGYYSYKWAEVLDADAFGRFRDRGLFDREVGNRFRQAILSRGDSADPEELFVEFMGRAPDPEALLIRSGLQ